MRRGAERSRGRSPARGDVRSAGGGGRAGTGAARRGQLLRAGERQPAAGRRICGGPGAGQPSHPVRGPVRLAGRGTAPGSPEPFAIQACLARARTERRREGGRLREPGGSGASISAPSGAGLRGRGAPGTGECAGQGRVRTAGRTRGHRLRALRCCPPEPFRFPSAALPAHLGWFLSERGFAVFLPLSDRAKGTRRKGILGGAA